MHVAFGPPSSPSNANNNTNGVDELHLPMIHTKEELNMLKSEHEENRSFRVRNDPASGSPRSKSTPAARKGEMATAAVGSEETMKRRTRPYLPKPLHGSALSMAAKQQQYGEEEDRGGRARPAFH